MMLTALKKHFNGLARRLKGIPSQQDIDWSVWSAATGRYDDVKKYIRRYPRYIEAYNQLGYAALPEAAHAGMNNIMQMLISAGADINKRDLSGETPLMKAVTGNKAHTVRFLLDAGADPFIQDHFCLRPRDVASLRGHTEVEALLACAEEACLEKQRRAQEKDAATAADMQRNTQDVLTNGVVPDARMAVRIRLKKR